MLLLKQKYWIFTHKTQHTIVEFSLTRASTGPEAIESNMPYISIFPPKLCNIHLIHIQIWSVMDKFNYEIKRQILEGRYQMSYKRALKIKNSLMMKEFGSLEGKKMVTIHRGHHKTERKFSKLVWLRQIDQELSFSQVEQNARVPKISPVFR